MFEDGSICLLGNCSCGRIACRDKNQHSSLCTHLYVRVSIHSSVHIQVFHAVTKARVGAQILREGEHNECVLKNMPSLTRIMINSGNLETQPMNKQSVFSYLSSIELPGTSASMVDAHENGGRTETALVPIRICRFMNPQLFVRHAHTCITTAGPGQVSLHHTSNILAYYCQVPNPSDQSTISLTRSMLFDRPGIRSSQHSHYVQ